MNGFRLRLIGLLFVLRLLTGCLLNSTGFGGAGGTGGQGDTTTASSGGTGGDAGNSSSTGGSGGSTSSGGGGSSSTTGTGGTAGSGGAGGSGGQGGGTGGTGGSPVDTCFGGEQKSPTTLVVNNNVAGSSQARAYVLWNNGSHSSDSMEPVVIDCSLNEFPAVLVSSGHNGLDMQLPAAPIAYPHYNADTTNVSECQGIGFYSDACDYKVAVDLWCQLFPSEQPVCAVTTVFASLGLLKTYNVSNPGDSKIAGMVRCQP